MTPECPVCGNPHRRGSAYCAAVLDAEEGRANYTPTPFVACPIRGCPYGAGHLIHHPSHEETK